MQRSSRLKREMQVMATHPPPGVSCFFKGDCLNILEATIIGMEDSPYAGGVFKLEIQIPDKYPFEPPHVQFKTSVYHPNVDVSGRICLDLLKPPPKGGWTPVINIAGLLTAVQLLLTTPNPDDPLMAEIADEYRYNKTEFERKAKEWTRRHAAPDIIDNESMQWNDLEEQDCGNTVGMKRKSVESLGKSRFKEQKLN